MHPEDVAGLVQIVRDTGFFRLDEVAAAQEVLEDCVTKGESSGYYVHVAEESEKLLGWVCFGPTPLTLGTWDLYWIAVAPDHQGRGIGTRLMCLAEEEICRQGGRLVLVETSSQELYTPTRRFYDSLGYREVSRILDFYDLGDAKVTYAKVMLREVMNS
jgi:ribosomal protein S18 acetylase RimI-like enzyme